MARRAGARHDRHGLPANAGRSGWTVGSGPADMSFRSGGREFSKTLPMIVNE